jgi:hypothetical protein
MNLQLGYKQIFFDYPALSESSGGALCSTAQINETKNWTSHKENDVDGLCDRLVASV